MKKLILALASTLMLSTSSFAQKNVTVNVPLPNVDSLKKEVSTTVSNTVSDLTKSLKETTNKLEVDSMLGELKGIVPDTTLPFYKQVYGDLKGAAISMANGLGIAIKELFSILCMQQIVKSIVNVLVMIICVLLALWCRRLYKSAKFDEMNGHGALFLLLGAISIAMFTFSCYYLMETITGFVNPKYGAIKDIVEMASDIKNGRGVK